MPNIIRIKRSGTASATPSSLEFGELALNYADGKLYYKNSSNAIVQISGGGGTGVSVSDTTPSSPTTGQLWFESDTGKLFIYYDSSWVDISGSDGATGPTGPAGSGGADLYTWSIYR